MADPSTVKRRCLIPEVLQRSDQEGGVACLKAVLSGYDVTVPYAELLEAIESNRDGHPLAALGVVAGSFGLRTRQIQRPRDLVLPAPSICLPAIATTESPDGAVRCVVLWRVQGPWVQVMDPSAGRVWIPRDEVLSSLPIGEHAAPASEWEEWSNSDEFMALLETRMRALGARGPLWADRAHQDASLRLAGVLRRAGKLGRGREAQTFLDLCSAHPDAIPREYWSSLPEAGTSCSRTSGVGASGVGTTGAGTGVVTLRGATLLTASGLSPATNVHRVRSRAPRSSAPAGFPPGIWAPVREALRSGGRLLPCGIAAALCVAAFGNVLEALLFRGWFDMGRHLQSPAERLAALAALIVFLTLLLALDWPAALGMYRLGRRLELRLRAGMLMRVPRAVDGFWQNRRIGDLAFRAHWLYSPRQLPETVGYGLYLIANILVTGAALMWVYPGSGLLVCLAVLTACGVPMLFLPRMAERDLRFREHSAALASIHLDSLLGSRAIQAHCAEHSLQAAHAARLRAWATAGMRLQALFVRSDALQMASSFGCVMALIYRQCAAADGPSGLLLLIYWAISIPLLGREVATAVRSIPAMRTTLARYQELMSAAREDISEATSVAGTEDVAKTRGVRIDFDDVCVDVAGHRVLHEVTLHVEAGEHVGIVGTSGAGKSSLVGCLLGWYRPKSGSLRVDEAALDPAQLARLRSETAWIDPQVHLFRGSLFDNLRYGNSGSAAVNPADALECADLGSMLERLPVGLQTPLGEGGTLISGGEGQRVRLGRAFGRHNVRLAILDEPARGLGHEQRRRLLATCRRRFSGATLLCVTHDVSDTLEFDRVLVVDSGRIIEQGPPHILGELPTSRYRRLLDEERAVRRELWVNAAWRRMTLKSGVLHEAVPGGDGRGFGDVRAINDVRTKQP